MAAPGERLRDDLIHAPSYHRGVPSWHAKQGAAGPQALDVPQAARQNCSDSWNMCSIATLFFIAGSSIARIKATEARRPRWTSPSLSNTITCKLRTATASHGQAVTASQTNHGVTVPT